MFSSSFNLCYESTTDEALLIIRCMTFALYKTGRKRERGLNEASSMSGSSAAI